MTHLGGGLAPPCLKIVLNGIETESVSRITGGRQPDDLFDVIDDSWKKGIERKL